MVQFITMAPTSGDGKYVGNFGNNNQKSDTWTGTTSESAEIPATFDYIKSIAQEAEKWGYDALLLPTGGDCLDSLVVASNLIAYTEKIKFLIAVRPGFTAPATFARQFATLDAWSNGRALVNIVTGGSPKDLASDGDFLDHGARYRRTGEFIQILKKLFNKETFSYEGEFFKLENASLNLKLSQVPPIYFGGSSKPALKVASELSDVYMMWGETYENSRDLINEIKQLVAEKNRNVSYSISFQVIIGETEEEAWAKANEMVSKLPENQVETKQQVTNNVEAVGVKRLSKLMTEAKENNFIIGPNLWAGLTQVLSGNSIALVGTKEQITDRIIEYVNLGFDKVLLRGFPHLDTIQQVGEQIIPLVHEKLNKQTVHNS